MKTLALLSLVGLISASTETTTATTTRSAEATDALSKLDMGALQKEIMKSVSEKLLERDLSKQIEETVEARVQEELSKQREEDKMYKFKEFTDHDWRKYDQLVLYQKLQNVLGDLGKDTWQDYMWQGLSEAAKRGPLRKFKVEFDLDENKIDVATKATDNDGKPLYEWKLDSNLGEIQHIKRIALVDPKKIKAEDEAKAKVHEAATHVETHSSIPESAQSTVTEAISTAKTHESTTHSATTDIPSTVETHSAPAAATTHVEAHSAPAAATTHVEAHSAPATQKSSAANQAVVVEHVTPIEAPIDPDFDNLENQRDLAFKIVYFFIMFIIATFGLLYAYFKMDKKEQEKMNREKRAKGTFFGDIDNRTFFDFLAGSVDQENYQVNPNARTGISDRTSIQEIKGIYESTGQEV